MRRRLGIISAVCIFISVCNGREIHVPLAYSTIQEAVDAAVDGDRIVLADGIFEGPGNTGVTFHGKDIRVVAANGPEGCIIDGGGISSGFLLISGEPVTAGLTGVTVRNTWEYSDPDHGGAVTVRDSSATLDDCIFFNNRAMQGGAIQAMHAGSVHVTRCRIEDNEADFYGGAVYVRNSGVFEVRDCEIRGNEGVYYGGGVCCTSTDLYIRNTVLSRNFTFEIGGAIMCSGQSRLTLTDSRITDNSAFDFSGWYGDGGGVILRTGSSAEITNCLIHGNYAHGSGGAIYGEAGTNLHLRSCTVTGNDAFDSGGGVYAEAGAHAALVNSILWADDDGSGSGEIHSEDNQVTATYCDIDGGYPGQGNLDADPLFVVIGSWYALSQTAAGQEQDSPCVNAGNCTAESECHDTGTGPVCMDQLSTRTDQVDDTGILDMGAHFFPDEFTPLETTPTPLPDRGLTLSMPDRSLVPGDRLLLRYTLSNQPGPTCTADIWILLKIGEEYWCFPSWSRLEDSPDYLPGMDMPEGNAMSETVLDFIWPEISGESEQLYFLGAACYEGTMNIIGELQVVTWEYHS